MITLRRIESTTLARDVPGVPLLSEPAHLDKVADLHLRRVELVVHERVGPAPHEPERSVPRHERRRQRHGRHWRRDGRRHGRRARRRVRGRRARAVRRVRGVWARAAPAEGRRCRRGTDPSTLRSSSCASASVAARPESRRQHGHALVAVTPLLVRAHLELHVLRGACRLPLVAAPGCTSRLAALPASRGSHLRLVRPPRRFHSGCACVLTGCTYVGSPFLTAAHYTAAR